MTPTGTRWSPRAPATSAAGGRGRYGRAAARSWPWSGTAGGRSPPGTEGAASWLTGARSACGSAVPLADVPPTPLVEAEAERLRRTPPRRRRTADHGRRLPPLGGHDLRGRRRLRRLPADHPSAAGGPAAAADARPGRLAAGGARRGARRPTGRPGTPSPCQFNWAFDPGAEIRQLHRLDLLARPQRPAGVITVSRCAAPGVAGTRSRGAARSTPW